MASSKELEITVTLNDEQIKQKIDAGSSRAQKVLDTLVLRDSNKYAPMDTSALIKSGITSTVIGSGLVTWSAPYSRAQYYGKPNKSHQKNPNASMRWFEVAKSKNLETWIKAANDEFSK